MGLLLHTMKTLSTKHKQDSPQPNPPSKPAEDLKRESGHQTDFYEISSMPTANAPVSVGAEGKAKEKLRVLQLR